MRGALPPFTLRRVMKPGVGTTIYHFLEI